MEYLSPKLDIVFKKMFGDKDNLDLLKSLLKTYLGFDEEGEYTLSNTEITPEELERKFARLDLHVSTKTREVDIEIQVNDEGDFSERSLYYWASLFTSTVGVGEGYFKAKKVLSLNILDFVMFDKCDNFNTNFTLYDSENKLRLTDKLNISFVELPKVRNYTREQIRNDNKAAWAAFFNARSEEDFDMVTQTVENPEIQKAVMVIKQLSDDEEMRVHARRREEALINERSARDAISERSRVKTINSMAKALRSMGVDEEKIQAAAREASQIQSQDRSEDYGEDEDMDFEP